MRACGRSSSSWKDAYGEKKKHLVLMRVGCTASHLAEKKKKSHRLTRCKSILSAFGESGGLEELKPVQHHLTGCAYT